MNPIPEALACCPLKYPRELIQALERLWGRMGGEQREGQMFPLFNRSQESGVWRVSRVGSVPREESGGGDRWMRSTSGNVGGMTGPGGKSGLAAGQGVPCFGGWEAVKGNVFHCFSPCPHPTPDTQTHSPGPLLKPTMDYLGLAREESGREERGRHKEETLLPSKGLSEIKLMECVSVSSQEDWEEGWGGNVGAFVPAAQLLPH